MDVRFRPISEWPGKRTPPNRQKDGTKTFGLSYTKTLDSLGRELEKLKAKDVVIEADFDEASIRLDGWPRAGLSPRTSGVVLSFTGDHGPLRIPCDYFKGYTHNLRAIALHLERLRLANNYGVGQHGEQYKGWKRIAAPAPPAIAPKFGSIEVAAWFIAHALYPSKADAARTAADLIVSSPESYRQAYRNAASVLHPDVRDTGSADAWQMLCEAKRMLDGHHKIAVTMEARP